MKKFLIFIPIYFLWIIVIAQPCAENFTGYFPIAECTQTYVEGKLGGKYPNGKNAIPLFHYNLGLKLSNEIRFLDSNGQENLEEGKIGFLILGFSTAAMTGRYMKIIHKILFPYSRIEFIIGAQGGRDLNSMTQSTSSYWKNLDSILSAQNMSESQIQFVWISTGDMTSYQMSLQHQIENETLKYQLALKNIKEKFSQLKIVFISDRPYAGYIKPGYGPMELSEPTAYKHAWTVKNVIEKQLMRSNGFSYAEIPFIDWGQTLWTDGSKGNKKGFTWDCDDAGKGGIHPTPKGRIKESALLLHFFYRHPFTRDHF